MNYKVEGKDENEIVSIIKNKSIIAYFQPIVSVVSKSVIGVEGLIRGINQQTKEIVSPVELFETAKKNGLTLELDRACMQKCIESFYNIYSSNKDLILFLNVDSSIIELIEGSNLMLKRALELNINPRNIIIEINESKVNNLEPLMRFVNTYRKHGFLIALDDLGSGFSNLDRVSVLKPDIIKLDRSLITRIKEDPYKQEVFKGIISLANRIGTLVVAEGVETEEETLLALEFGAQFLQGYFIAKPQLMDNHSLEIFTDKTVKTAASYWNYMKDKVKNQKLALRTMDSKLNDIIIELIDKKTVPVDDLLIKYVALDDRIECAYILDEQGIQISNTVCKNKAINNKKHLMFNPANNGTDHSLKKYYYQLMNAKMNKYITEPYISLATGNRCVTISKIFKYSDQKKFILCVDFIRF